MLKRICAIVVGTSLIAAWSQSVSAATPAELLKTIKAVQREGKGNVAAQRAWKELAKSDATALLGILAAFDGASPLALNWLRSAVETIAARTQNNGGKLPMAEFEKMLANRKANPTARRLAFVLLRQADAKRAEKLVPGLLLDPSADLRREAVAKLIDAAVEAEKNKDTKAAATLYQTALTGAVEDDQVKAIVAPLKKLGVKVDLQKHFGFLTAWSVIGPFDNTDLKGYHVPHPPEKTIDLMASYKAKFVGKEIKVNWVKLSTKDPYGIVDIAGDLTNYALPKDVVKNVDTLKSTLMYATTVFHSSTAQTVQFRIGTPNSWKIWVNGKLLFAREEYHRGMMLDQYRVDAPLKAGKNVILLKIAQNDQGQTWQKRYQFQFRVCDATGSAVYPLPLKKTSLREETSTKRVLK